MSCHVTTKPTHRDGAEDKRRDCPCRIAFGCCELILYFLPYGWTESCKQNSEFHTWTKWVSVICAIQSKLQLCHSNIFSFFFLLTNVPTFPALPLLIIFAHCVFHTCWHSVHSTGLNHLWSGHTGSDSWASKIRFLCIFAWHHGFYLLLGEKGGEPTFSRSARTFERQFQTSDRVMDEGSGGHQSSAAQS